MKHVLFNTLSEEQQQALLMQPESGMGYQILQDDTITGGPLVVAANGQDILYFEDPQNSPVLRQRNQLERAMPLPMGAQSLVAMRSAKFTEADLLCLVEVIEDVLKGGLPPFCELTQPGDLFIRLSAYPNDFRISPKGQPKGSVAAGTYATTMNDLTAVPSGLAAVGRYALPTRLAACYQYLITPPPGSLVMYGTVTPNYGMSGGGVEVFFPCGLPGGSAELIAKQLSPM